MDLFIEMHALKVVCVCGGGGVILVLIWYNKTTVAQCILQNHSPQYYVGFYLYPILLCTRHDIDTIRVLK